MDRDAKLLSEPSNYAVVQLPDRNFPGVVFQGDSLHAILGQVERIRKLASKYKDEDLFWEIEDLHELLTEVESFFQKVCEEKGLKLPNPK